MAPTGVADPIRGIREIVVGTGGSVLYRYGAAVANSEVRNSSAYGVLQISFRTDGYGWRFFPVAGKTFTDSGSAACH